MAADDDGEDSQRDRLLTFLAGRLNGQELLKVISILDGADDEDADADEAEAAVQAADRRRQASDARIRSLSADTERRARLFPNAHRLVR